MRGNQRTPSPIAQGTYHVSRVPKDCDLPLTLKIRVSLPLAPAPNQWAMARLAPEELPKSSIVDFLHVIMQEIAAVGAHLLFVTPHCCFLLGFFLKLRPQTLQIQFTEPLLTIWSE